jgi:hypothetical protein
MTAFGKRVSSGVAYDICFRHSTFVRKAKEITFPMASVSYPTKFGVVRNHQNNTDLQNRFWCCATILAR